MLDQPAHRSDSLNRPHIFRRRAVAALLACAILLADSAAFAADALHTFKGHDAPVRAVAVTPDGRRVLSADDTGAVHVWNAATGETLKTLTGHQGAVKAVAVSPDGRYAITGSADTTLKVWDLESGRARRSLRGHFDTVTGAAVSPDGQRIVSGSLDEAVMLWDAETGESLRTFLEAPASGGDFVPLQPVLAVAFSPDGTRIASAHAHTLKLWNAESGRHLLAFPKQEGEIPAIAFSPDGKTLAVAGRDGSIRLGSTGTGEWTRVLKGHEGAVTALAFSPDGEYLISAGRDGTVRLWQNGRGPAVKVFEGHTEAVHAVAFSLDGRFAVSGGADRTVRRWDITPFITPEVVAEKPKSETAQPKAEPPQTEPAPVPETKADTDPPKIVITSHALTRGIVLVPALPETFVEGRATDASGIARVTVNGKAAHVDVSGNFSADVPLDTGKTKIEVMAEDTRGNIAWEKFWVEGKTAPSQQLAKAPKPKTPIPAEGGYHALVIGIDHYRHLPPLKTAIHDAREVERILREQYGFTTTLLIDPGRDAIMDAFNRIRLELTAQDHFLIYYAGHGHFDKTVNKAYWLPLDAQPESDTKWIIVDNITSNIRRMAAKHVLVVADSCYSGTLTRAAITRLTTAEEKRRFLEKMRTRSSRTLMASGGNEPVADGGGGGHSVFARAFIEALQKPETDIFTAEQLFHDRIKERVAGSAEQVPEYNIIKNSGHEGGDFVFIKR